MTVNEAINALLKTSIDDRDEIVRLALVGLKAAEIEDRCTSEWSDLAESAHEVDASEVEFAISQLG